MSPQEEHTRVMEEVMSHCTAQVGHRPWRDGVANLFSIELMPKVDATTERALDTGLGNLSTCTITAKLCHGLESRDQKCQKRLVASPV